MPGQLPWQDALPSCASLGKGGSLAYDPSTRGTNLMFEATPSSRLRAAGYVLNGCMELDQRLDYTDDGLGAIIVTGRFRVQVQVSLDVG